MWPESSIDKLRGCFEDTDWDVFNGADCLDEYADTVSAYVRFCEEVCLPEMTITQYPNCEPWFDNCFRNKVRARDDAYKLRSDNRIAYRKAKYDFEKSIKPSKRKYRQRLGNIWIQTIHVIMSRCSEHYQLQTILGTDRH